MNKNILILIISLILSFYSHAQELREVSVFTQVGYLAGGQITSNTFVYQSGVSARVGVSHKVSETFSLGLGSGIDRYDVLDFFPVYGQVRAQKDQKKNGYLSVQGGYAFTANKSTGVEVLQRFKGGAFLELGRAWVYPVTEKINFSAGVFIKHQYARSYLQNQVGQKLEQNINFSTLHFRIGVDLK
ncbi:MAG: hypothetical protein AB8B53_11795 [Flavobacteriales bacterium]